MSFLITRRPEKHFSTTKKTSRWTALGNPYLFEFIRSDFAVKNTLIRVAYSTTRPTVWINANPVEVALLIYPGDQIYLNSGAYNGVYTVFSVTGVYVVIDTPNIGNGGPGRLNATQRLTNFKAYVKVYNAITNVLIDTLYPKPDSTGLLTCDVSGVIQSTVKTEATIGQTVINKANKGISGSFKIGYGATYTVVFPASSYVVTIPEIPSSPVGNPQIYYWLAAARQIEGNMPLSINGIGQNMKEYVPKELVGSAAKFLTMFERPTYFEGFPFLLSFIYDEDFSSVYLERHQQDVDVNGANVGAETDNTLLISERKYVNQMKIRALNAGADGFDVWLETGGVVTNGYVKVGSIPKHGANEYSAPWP